MAESRDYPREPFGEFRKSLHEPEAINGKPFRFKLVAFENIAAHRDAAYSIKGILPREGLVCVWGPPKCGKSFWALDTVMHITLGRPYRGRKVQQSTTVYIACEGERGLGARVAAWKKERLGDHDDLVPFYLLTTRLRRKRPVMTLVSGLVFFAVYGSSVLQGRQRRL